MDKESNTLKRQIGQNIRKYRIACGFTQAGLAEMIGVEPSTIGHVESGSIMLSVSNLCKAAECLHTTCNGLVYQEDVGVRIENINLLLENRSPEYIANIERIIRICSELDQK